MKYLLVCFGAWLYGAMLAGLFWLVVSFVALVRWWRSLDRVTLFDAAFWCSALLVLVAELGVLGWYVVAIWRG